MKRLGSVLALAGLALAVVLYSRQNLDAVRDLLELAGAGLVLASVVHVVPMVLNARAWQCLFANASSVPLGRLVWATWARESVNALLPVARIGGEIVAYRIVRRGVVSGAEVASTLVVDMTLCVVTQAAFTIVGLAILVAHGGNRALTVQLALAGGLLLVLGGTFMFAQRGGVVSGVTRRLNRWFAGSLDRAIAGSLRIDEAIRACYDRRGAIARCVLWQGAGWIAGSAEIWLALHFLGHPRSVLEAIMLDALIQAVSSVAFVVPGALGVQEGGFLLIGAALGLDGNVALALAAARRLRDLIVYFPGLAAWHWAEARWRNEAPERSSNPS